ncbi:glycosyltransferase family 39 protein [Nocardia yamanashiensis]|uniref:ArnT family glycosyltransferase n=1 Tax=Nocardia yamanashiensis TaxID=209247 RepID=UPI001E2C532E|nr:glycosyltransferase family 39 protein [Nocardia yamanashiensis]UGT38820.1 glycosyltransferase family 39 protein [Nocardia yamanashiensis]
MTAVVTVRTEPEAITDAHPPFAFRGVALMSAISLVVLTVAAGRYEFFGDELYFLSAGRRLDYTYADQGVVVAFFAHIADVLAPGSVTAVRVPAVVMGVGAIVLSALIAYELRAGRRIQLLAAFTYATSNLLVTQCALSTFSFDATLTAVITWLLIRWVRTRQDRLIIAAGLVAALDMQVKWMVPLVWACLGVAVVLCGPREILRRRALWVATGILALSAVPILYWQSQHNWPQLAMGSIIGAEQDATGYGPLGFFPQWLVLAGFLGVPLIAFGFWGVFKQESLRPYRFIAIAMLLMTVFVVATHGRPYYPTGFFPAMFALGAVAFWQFDRKRWMNLATIPLIAITAAAFIGTLVLVPLPPSWRSQTVTPIDLGIRSALWGTTNWSRMVAAVDTGYRTLTPEEQAHSAIITQGYWQGGAVEQFGGKYDLPATFSPSRGFGFFGPPPNDTTTIVFVGLNTAEADLKSRFAEVERVVELDDPMGTPGIDRMVAVWKCKGPKLEWPQLWDTWTTLYFDLGHWRDSRATTRPTH